MGKMNLLKYCLKSPGYAWNRQRSAVWLLIMLFISYVFLAPLDRYAMEMGYGVSPYVLPHMISNLYYQLSMMACVLYFYADIPFMNQKELYRVFRSGRMSWTLSYIFYIVVAGFGMIIVTAVCSLVILLPVIDWSTEWGKILYTLAAFGEEHQLINIEFDILNYFTPLQAMFVSIVLGGLTLGCFGLFLFMVSLYTSRTVSLTAGMILVMLPLLAENLLNLKFNVKIWYFSPLSWMRLTRIELTYRQGLPNLRYAVFSLIILSIVFGVASVWKVRRLDFDLNNE